MSTARLACRRMTEASRLVHLSILISRRRKKKPGRPEYPEGDVRGGIINWSCNNHHSLSVGTCVASEQPVSYLDVLKLGIRRIRHAKTWSSTRKFLRFRIPVGKVVARIRRDLAERRADSNLDAIRRARRACVGRGQSGAGIKIRVGG